MQLFLAGNCHRCYGELFLFFSIMCFEEFCIIEYFICGLHWVLWQTFRTVIHSLCAGNFLCASLGLLCEARALWQQNKNDNKMERFLLLFQSRRVQCWLFKCRLLHITVEVISVATVKEDQNFLTFYISINSKTDNWFSILCLWLFPSFWCLCRKPCACWL